MKTLYVSDLDGTLLTPQKEISQHSAAVINKLLQQGMQFTVATARSAATAAELVASLQLTLPGVLLNGVLLYDFKEKRYLDCVTIDYHSAQQVLNLFHRYHRPPFVYLMEENNICVEFERLCNAAEINFYHERKGKAYKRFQQVEQLEILPESKVIYFTMMDSKEILAPIWEQLKQMDGIRTAFYRDNYSDIYFLEIFSKEASKSAGIQKLKELCKAERLVAFGDNFNDLDMLREADAGLAVADGVPEVKLEADGIIGNSYEDGVARYLEETFCR